MIENFIEHLLFHITFCSQRFVFFLKHQFPSQFVNSKSDNRNAEKHIMKTTLLSFGFISLAYAAPRSTSCKDCTSVVTIYPRIWTPEMHSIMNQGSINPNGEVKKQFPVKSLYSTLSLMKTTNSTRDLGQEWQQVAVFRNIPEYAKSCTLGIQLNTGAHLWSALHNGWFRADLLSEVPEDKDMIWDKVQPLVKEMVDEKGNSVAALSHDSTNWNTAYPSNAPPEYPSLLGVPTDCARVMGYRLKLDPVQNQNFADWGSLVIEQTQNLGLYLTYKL